MSQEKITLPLTEYQPADFPPEMLTDDLGEILWQEYGSQVDVDFPSPKTGGQWRLTPRGWVGYIPLTPTFGLLLQPKVVLDNLFRMLEYAYRLKSFQFLEGVVESESLEEFYERLANILAQRVLDRSRKGLYRAYLGEEERLPYIRGRLDVRRAIQKPWEAKLHCHYEHHTPDIEENQILAWTLQRIARSGACSERVLPTVRQAYRALWGAVSLAPFSPDDCVGRLYNRLNEDYEPLHGLCRFFLEHSGPSHEMGDRTTLPFLVNMARLFELFVAEWLKTHLPDGLTLTDQETVVIGESGNLNFNIDLVLSDAETGEVYAVLDTKYKVGEPKPGDISQVVTYAEMKGCDQAVLIYPEALSSPLDVQVGHIRVQSAAFLLKGDLEENGEAFLAALVKEIVGLVALK